MKVFGGDSYSEVAHPTRFERVIFAFGAKVRPFARVRSRTIYFDNILI
jgi:hypothetical protein